MNNYSRKDSIPGYLYALDGLRALSLIFIVVFHTWQQTWIYANIQLTNTFRLIDLETIQRYGYVAIDAFFVLSGFCLFYPIARDMFGESKFDGWKNFYVKRARRIYPSYILMLIILIIFPKLSYALYNYKDFVDVLKHTLLHVFFIHTWDSSALGSMISTAWTMGIEVQFYLIFPLICIPFRKKPILTFLGLVIIGFGTRLWLMNNTNASDMIMQAVTPAYFDVFGLGMICAYFVVYVRNKVSNMDKLKLCMTLMAIACLVIAYGYMQWLRAVVRDARFPDGYNASVYFRFLYRGIFATAIAGFIFTSCFSYNFWERKIWGNKFFVFLSSISYTVYLWHQNIYIFLKKSNIPYTTQNPVTNDRHAMEGMAFLCIITSILIGVIVTKYIETPIVRYGFKGAIIKLFQNIKSIPSKIKKS